MKSMYNIISFEDFTASPEEYPLYDFSSESKQHFWPWSYLIPKDQERDLDGKFYIPRAIKDENSRTFQAHRMERWYEAMNRIPNEKDITYDEKNELIIIEGVGIHKMESENSCTFLVPAELSARMVGGSWHPIPTLLMVTLDNDSEVYFRGWYGRDFTPDKVVQKHEIYENPRDLQILYDLMGNKIENPVSGSIYICNGKKIVWK